MANFHPGQSAANLVRIALTGGNNVRLELRNGSKFDVDSPVIVHPEVIQFPSREIGKMMTVRFEEIIAVQPRCDNGLRFDNY